MASNNTYKIYRKPLPMSMYKPNFKRNQQDLLLVVFIAKAYMQ